MARVFLRKTRETRVHSGHPWVFLSDTDKVEGEFVNGEPGAEDTDEWALANNYVAVVPVQTDLTDYRQLSGLRNVLK